MSGCEWIVEAHGCDASALTEIARLEAVFARIIEGMRLHPVDASAWHQFPGTGGVTGVRMLSESHIACHTFPESRSLCLNVFCCKPRPEWDFETCLKQELGASLVQVRRIDRPYHDQA